jgi:hypothetical protein
LKLARIDDCIAIGIAPESTARDKSLWEGRAVPEQQYIKSRNAAAQTAKRFGIARQKLLALGINATRAGMTLTSATAAAPMLHRPVCTARSFRRTRRR